MEILKIPIDEKTIKIEIGSSISQDKKSVVGPIELDMRYITNVSTAINDVIEEGKKIIKVNLSNISYIDSWGLGILCEGHKRAQQRNGALMIINPSQIVTRIINMTKISSRIQVVTE